MKLEQLNISSFSPKDQFTLIETLAHQTYLSMGSWVPLKEIEHGFFSEKTHELFSHYIKDLSPQHQNWFHVAFLKQARQALEEKVQDSVQEDVAPNDEPYDPVKGQMAYQNHFCKKLEIDDGGIRLFDVSVYAKTGKTVFYHKKEYPSFNYSSIVNALQS